MDLQSYEYFPKHSNISPKNLQNLPHFHPEPYRFVVNIAKQQASN